MLPSSQKDDFIRAALKCGRYRVTSDGTIESIINGRVRALKPSPMKDGYFRVGLSVGGVVHYVKHHRVIAIALIPNPDNKPQVNHIDGCKSNWHPSNLEWVSQSENVKHAVSTGLVIHARGAQLPQSKLTESEVAEIRRLAATGTLTQREIGERFGVRQNTVSVIVSGKIWRRGRTTKEAA